MQLSTNTKITKTAERHRRRGDDRQVRRLCLSIHQFVRTGLSSIVEATPVVERTSGVQLWITSFADSRGLRHTRPLRVSGSRGICLRIHRAGSQHLKHSSPRLVICSCLPVSGREVFNAETELIISCGDSTLSIAASKNCQHTAMNRGSSGSPGVQLCERKFTGRRDSVLMIPKVKLPRCSSHMLERPANSYLDDCCTCQPRSSNLLQQRSAHHDLRQKN